MTCGRCATDRCPLEGADQRTYELHVTVAPVSNTGDFIRVCRALGVKPVLLENIDRRGNTIREALTARTLKGASLPQVRRCLQAQEILLKPFGVTRVKVETVPWHRLANRPVLDAGQYFESHVNVRGISVDEVHATGLRLGSSWHASRKQGDGDGLICTLRQAIARPDHTAAVNRFLDDLRERSITVEKVRGEFAIYDSNPGLDRAWMA